MWRPEPDNITCTLEGVDAILDWHWKAPDDVYYDQDGSYPRPELGVLKATREVAAAVLDGIEDEVDITTDVLGGMAIHFGAGDVIILNSGTFHLHVYDEKDIIFHHHNTLEDLLERLAREYRNSRRL